MRDDSRSPSGRLVPEARKRIRLLLLTSRLASLGGSEKHLLTLATRLPRERFEVWVRSLVEGPLVETLRRKGVDAAALGLATLASPTGAAEIWRLARWMRRTGIEVVLSYHEDADIVSAIAGSLGGAPVLISTRRDMGRLASPIQRRAIRVLNRRFDRLIAVSEAVKREIVAEQGIATDRVSVVHNGVESDGASTRRTDALRRLLGLPATATVVGMVASFRPVKRQDVFVRAAVRVLRDHPNAEFVIVGYVHRPYYNEVAALMDDLGVASKVHCVGERRDVPELLRSMDLFVLSSAHEGFSNALLEAMAAGLPVVAPASGGNPEVVGPDVGILVPPGDSEALAAAIGGLLADAGRREAMGRAARALVTSRFSIADMVRRYEGVIEGELARRMGTARTVTEVSASCP